MQYMIWNIKAKKYISIFYILVHVWLFFYQQHPDRIMAIKISRIIKALIYPFFITFSTTSQGKPAREKNQKLLNHIMEKGTEGRFKAFCKGLKDTDQEHIVINYLTF